MSINSEIRAAFIQSDSGTETQIAIVDGSFNFERGGTTTEPINGGGQKLGVTEAFTTGTCTLSVAHLKGTNLGVFEILNGAIRIVWDTGDQWVMTKASLTSPISGSAPGGLLELSYNGAKWRQLGVG